MHNKNKYLAIAISSTLLFSSLAQAEVTGPGAAGFTAAGQALQNANTMTQQAQGSYNQAMDAADNMQQRADATNPTVPPKPLPPNVGNPGFTQFLDASKVSDVQKQEILTAIKSYTDGLKTVLDDTDLTQDQKALKIGELNASLVSKILPFVATAKLEAFNKFVADKGNNPLLPPPQKKGEEPKPAPTPKAPKNAPQPKSQENKKNALKKAKVLSQRTTDSFNQKLDALPQEKKETVFNAVIKKIDSLLGNVKSEKVLAQLNELKDIVLVKLNELGSQSSEGDLLNQVLNGTDVNSTGSTSAQ